MKRQRWILGILALLPLMFPFGYCDSPFLPQFLMCNDCDGTIFVLLVVVFGMVMPPYWCFLGILSGHWFPHSKKAVFLCNLPIFFNAVAEILYYAVLGIPQESHLFWEFIIGSHLDKITPGVHMILESLYAPAPIQGAKRCLVILICMLLYIAFFGLGQWIAGMIRGHKDIEKC